jgi:hypothetical protein
MYLMLFVSGFVCGGLTLGIIIRRYNTITNSERVAYESQLKRQEEDLRSRRQAIQTMIFDAQHNGPNPNLKNIRGLVQASRTEVKHFTRRLESLGKFSWAAAILLDFSDLDKVYLAMIEKECLIAEKKILDNVSRFNDLQE